MISRRQFILGISGAVYFAGLSELSANLIQKNGKFVVILLKGGMDGLSAVPPLGDNSLYDRRRDLVTSSPRILDGFYGLHPCLSNFWNLYQKNEAAIIHATNFPHINRSHFDCQNIIQTGFLRPYSAQTGWLGRIVRHLEMDSESMSLRLPLILRGSPMPKTFFPTNFKVIDDSVTKRSLDMLSDAHNGDVSAAFRSLNARKHGDLREFSRDPIHLARYVAKRFSEPNGPSVAVLELGQFDTHAEQGAESGKLYDQLRTLDDIFLTLRNGLNSCWANTTIVTLTEFGRTVEPNGSGGTDHGYGTVGFLAGGTLRGSNVLSDWPGLEKQSLFDGRDLKATIDFRSVLSACLEKSFGIGHEEIAHIAFGNQKLERITSQIFA
ncbi:MAG: DUF1501 domain-containing protein [Paracoccaceae bacterium]